MPATDPGWNPSRKSKAIWLVLDRGVRFVTALIGSALIARALAPGDFGLLAQALLVVSLLDTLAALGMPLVIGPRIAVLPPAQRHSLLLRALGVRTMAAVVCAAVALALLVGSGEEGASTHTLAITMAITLIATNWSMSDSFLQGTNAPQRGAAVKSATALVFVGVRLFHVNSGQATVVSLAMIHCAEQAVLSLAMLLTCWRGRPADSAPMQSAWSHLAKYAGTMWLSQIITLVYMRLDQGLISLLGERDQLAIYVVAAQLAEQAYALPTILSALFVGHIGAIAQAGETTMLTREMTRLYRLGFSTSLAITACAAAASPWVLPAIYGHAYAPSVPLFAILILCLPLVTLGSLQNLSIFTGHTPSAQIKKTAAAALFSVPAAWLGWTLHGLLGLAVSVVVVQGISCVISNWWFDRQAFRCQVHAMLLYKRIR